MGKIKKLYRKLKKVNKEYIAKTKYIKYYKKLPIIDNYILLDSQQGNNINGNIFYILKELNDNPIYSNYHLFVPVSKNKYEQFNAFLENKNIDRVQLIVKGTKKYYKLIASCKYLFNDTSFLPFFIKKEGQVYCNVWHGTPLKHLGRAVNDGYHAIGNVQKNFIISDYLLYPNEYMMNHMVRDYMLENISNAKIMLAGYPRNTVFFDKKRKEEIRKEQNIDDKQVIAYMPTYRDDSSVEEEVGIVTKLLKNIDKKLTKNQIMFVNLHPLVGDSIEYTFKHIKPFPKEYETYEFLNATDCLITDYSSVFFDYAITKNKIILFNYDEKEYFKNRGCYITLEELPFPKTPTIDKLMSEINNPKIVNYDSFLDTYCNYDCMDITKKICQKIILEDKVDIPMLDMPNNKKPNILLYTGSLAKNGITTALLNLLNTIDLDKYNYYLTFSSNMVKNHRATLKAFPEKVNYISTMGKANSTIYEKIMIQLYYRGIFKKYTQQKVNNVYRNDIKRLYGNIKLDTVIQFCGYDYKKILMYSLFDCNKVIYAHSNMKKEADTRGNQKIHILKYAYNIYDKVAVVSDSLVEPTKFFVKDSSKIYVVDNVIDNNYIIKNSEEEIQFDENTECNISLSKLKKVLNTKKYTKFINVGRFSKEKGHKRLIDSFARIWQENKNCYLIIIGGHGNIYGKTLEYVKSLPCRNNIVIIKSLLNPFPIVKKCDCFVLSSLYEGFGLCLVEADVLGLNSFSVDIDGPKNFILESHGNIVTNDMEGIYQGMKKYLNNELKKMQADYKKYNQKAIEEFYALLK